MKPRDAGLLVFVFGAAQYNLPLDCVSSSAFSMSFFMPNRIRYLFMSQPRPPDGEMTQH